MSALAPAGRAALWVLLAAGLSARAAAPSLAACEAGVRAQPHALASYRCYWNLAHAGQRAAAERGLETILRRVPENAGALLYLGLCQDERGLDARPLMERAIAGFQRAGEAEGEGYARLSLFAGECFEGRRCDEWRGQLDQAEALATAHGLTDLRAISTIWRARDALMADDLGAAERLLHVADGAVGPQGPFWLRRWIVDQRGLLYLQGGRHAEALDTYRELARMTEQSPAAHAQALGAMATAALQLAQRGELDRAEVERMARESLTAEDAAGVVQWTRYSGSLATRVLLAFLLGPSDDAVADLERVRLAQSTGGRSYPFSALWLLARFTFERDRRDPAAALRHANEALALCVQRSHDWERAHGLLVRGDILWRSGDRAGAIEDARGALASFERLRGRQPDATVRARYGASTAFAHQLVAGWLLDPSRSSPPDLAGAFEVMERLRARVLFEQLLAARDRSELPAALRERGLEVHQQSARLERRLREASLDSEREALRRSLDQTEGDEAAWRDEVARALPRFRSVDPTPPSLARLQATLRPAEAMLLFQTWFREPTPDAPYDDGSSWVLAVSRERVTAHRIPDGEQLQPLVDQWQALLDRRDGSERPGAARLFRDLLAAPLAALPPQTTDLIVVPDGPLQFLALDGLRAEANGPSVAERYVVSIAPSASLWLHWRGGAPTTHRGALLALADPLGPTPGDGERWRAPGATLGPLPGARSEAQAAVSAAGPGSLLRIGGEASEHFLKSADLTAFDLVHFATHALVDAEAPERSAVLLSPGDAAEDGLLRSREISELPLVGKVVVLAACRSASGQGLRGEGVMGLSRAFFEAGARGVVGNLSPLRDDDSAALLAAFYRELGDGQSVAQALAGAKRERIRAGAPPAAWAGMVALGEGALRPIPERHGPGRRRALWALLGVGGGVLVLGLAAVAWRRRRTEPSASTGVS